MSALTSLPPSGSDPAAVAARLRALHEFRQAARASSHVPTLGDRLRAEDSANLTLPAIRKPDQIDGHEWDYADDEEGRVLFDVNESDPEHLLATEWLVVEDDDAEASPRVEPLSRLGGRAPSGVRTTPSVMSTPARDDRVSLNEPVSLGERYWADLTNSQRLRERQRRALSRLASKLIEADKAALTFNIAHPPNDPYVSEFELGMVWALARAERDRPFTQAGMPRSDNRRGAAANAGSVRPRPDEPHAQRQLLMFLVCHAVATVAEISVADLLAPSTTGTAGADPLDQLRTWTMRELRLRGRTLAQIGEIFGTCGYVGDEPGISSQAVGKRLRT